MDGWIKLHRKFIDWEWFKVDEMMKLFIYLLLSVNYENKKWQGIDVNRGQILTGINSLHEKTKISHQTLRTCLKRLEKTGEINIQSTNKYSIITICNYDSYQCEEITTNKQPNKQLTSNQQTTNKQLTTTKEYKEYKEVKKIKNIVIPDFEEFKNYALEHKPKIDIQHLKLKFDSWKVNEWKDGNNNSIVNWKSKLLNTLPHIKETQAAQTKEVFTIKPFPYAQ